MDYDKELDVRGLKARCRSFAPRNRWLSFLLRKH